MASGGAGGSNGSPSPQGAPGAAGPAAKPGDAAGGASSAREEWHYPANGLYSSWRIRAAPRLDAREVAALPQAARFVVTAHREGDGGQHWVAVEHVEAGWTVRGWSITALPGEGVERLRPVNATDKSSGGAGAGEASPPPPPPPPPPPAGASPALVRHMSSDGVVVPPASPPPHMPQPGADVATDLLDKYGRPSAAHRAAAAARCLSKPASAAVDLLRRLLRGQNLLSELTFYLRFYAHEGRPINGSLMALTPDMLAMCGGGGVTPDMAWRFMVRSVLGEYTACGHFADVYLSNVYFASKEAELNGSLAATTAIGGAAHARELLPWLRANPGASVVVRVERACFDAAQWAAYRAGTRPRPRAYDVGHVYLLDFPAAPPGRERTRACFVQSALGTYDASVKVVSMAVMEQHLRFLAAADGDHGPMPSSSFLYHIRLSNFDVPVSLEDALPRGAGGDESDGDDDDADGLSGADATPPMSDAELEALARRSGTDDVLVVADVFVPHIYDGDAALARVRAHTEACFHAPTLSSHVPYASLPEGAPWCVPARRPALSTTTDAPPPPRAGAACWTSCGTGTWRRTRPWGGRSPSATSSTPRRALQRTPRPPRQPLAPEGRPRGARARRAPSSTRRRRLRCAACAAAPCDRAARARAPPQPSQRTHMQKHMLEDEQRAARARDIFCRLGSSRTRPS